MNKHLTLIIIIALLSACNSVRDTVSNVTNSISKPKPGSIKIAFSIPFSKNNTIKNNIKEECNLNTKLSENISAYASNIARIDKPEPDKGGKVLMIEVTDAISAGGGIAGIPSGAFNKKHKKSLTIKGELFDDGKPIGSFIGHRKTGGGFFGSYKGSCMVLNRATEVLGKDVGKWLKHPTHNAHIGERI